MKAFDEGAQTNPVRLDSSSDAADFKDGDGVGRLLCGFLTVSVALYAYRLEVLLT